MASSAPWIDDRAGQTGQVDSAMKQNGVSLTETPGVRAVVRALLAYASATQVRRALRLLAWEWSAAGSTHLDSLLADIDELWDAWGAGGPVSRQAARRHAIDAWVDAVAATLGAPCVDPLSGLHTPNYLIGRLHEIKRAAGDEPPALVLIVIRWHEPPNPWLRIATVIRVAEILTTHARPTATLCQATVSTALVLVPDDGRSREERSAIERELGADPATSHGLSVDIVPVVGEAESLPAFLDELLRHNG